MHRPKPIPHDRQSSGKQYVNIHVPIDKGFGVSATVCTQVLIEIIKYVVYQKQQIPYPYLHLKDIATQYAKESEEKTQQKKSPTGLHTKRNRQATLAYKSLEEIFQNLESELKQSSNDGAEEVVVLMGATPMSPQDVYHIQLPALSTGLCDTSASYRQSLMLLIRSLAASTCLNEIFSKPMAPTNTYVLLKKKSGGASQWFLPKDRYSVPTRGNQVFICLQQPISEQRDSPCSSIAPVFDNIDLCGRTSNDKDFRSVGNGGHQIELLSTLDKNNPNSCIVSSQISDFHIYDEYAVRKSNSPSNIWGSGRRSLQEGTSKPESEQLMNSRWYQSCTFLKGFK